MNKTIMDNNGLAVTANVPKGQNALIRYGEPEPRLLRNATFEKRFPQMTGCEVVRGWSG